MRVLELFAGAGGMALGFHRAGFDTVALAEWDDHARCVLRERLPDVPLYGDVTQVDGREVVSSHGDVDLVSGGAPCQDLSIAGKRAGLEGSRSILFYDLIRIWEETGATYCLYENVCGALSSNKGADFAAVLSAFVGADVPVPAKGWKGGGGVVAGPTGVAAWRVLDAQFFGVPQRRRRVFVLGARPGGVDPAAVLLEWEGMCGDSQASSEAGEAVARETDGGADSGDGVTTLGALDTECGYNKATFQSVLQGHIVPALPASGAGSPRTGNERTEAELVVVQGHVPDVAPTLTGRIAGVGQGWAPVNETAHIVAQPEAVGFSTTGSVGYLHPDLMPTPPHLTGTLKTDLAHDMGPVVASPPIGRPRRLLPVECERLMSWPDGWTDVPDPKGKPMADSHRYKMCGNGVVSHVAEWIGRQLLCAEANAQ